MMSRNSLLRQIYHNFVRRIWCFALLLILFFASMPMFLIARISQLQDVSDFPTNGSTLMDSFIHHDAFAPNGNVYCTVVVIIAAVICGLSSFCYLNSRSQVDLYHSMPIGRCQLFLVRYLSGYFLFVIPFLINLLLAGGVVLVNGWVEAHCLKHLVQLFFFENGYFLAIYTVVCLAVIVTGTMLNNLIAIAVFLLGEFGIHIVNSELASQLLSTYVYAGKKIACTPLFHLDWQIHKGDYDNNIEIFQSFFGNADGFLSLVFMTVIYFLLALLLFAKRPSEKAGKAIVFEKAQLPAKLLLTFVSTYASAYLIQSFFEGNKMSWFVFGAIAGFVLSHMLLEILFRGDFRACFQHLWHWAVDGAAIVLVFVAIWLDLFGYDTYIPKKEDIAYGAVDINGIDMQLGYYASYRGVYPNYFGTAPKSKLDTMELKDWNKLYELMELGVEKEEQKGVSFPFPSTAEEQMDYEGQSYTYSNQEELLEALALVKNDPMANAFGKETVDYTVRFTLKNGKQVTRKYTLSLNEQVLALIGAIYDQPAFKMGEYPLLSKAQEDFKVRRIIVQSPYGYAEKRLTEDEADAFMAIYSEELKKLTFQEIMETNGLGFMECEMKKVTASTASNMPEWHGGYPIYPSFVGTIQYLKGLGMDICPNPETFYVEQVEICTSGYYVDEEYIYHSVVYDSSDKQKLQDVIGKITWNYDIQDYIKRQLLFSVNVTYINEETGEVSTDYGTFKAGEVPVYVIEDLMKELEKNEESK